MIEKTSPIARFLVVAAAFVIVVSGLKMAGALLVPFLLAVFIAMIVSPLLGWLKDRGIPGGLAILLIVILILLVGLLLTAVFLIEPKNPQLSLRVLDYGARSRTKCAAFWARSQCEGGV